VVLGLEGALGPALARLLLEALDGELGQLEQVAECHPSLRSPSGSSACAARAAPGGCTRPPGTPAPVPAPAAPPRRGRVRAPAKAARREACRRASGLAPGRRRRG